MKLRSGRRRGRRKRAYDASGRQAAAQETATRIVDAATDLVKAGVRPADISYAEIGARAGVATRTVYRHFREMDDLMRAIAAGTLNRITGGRIMENPRDAAVQLALTHQVLS